MIIKNITSTILNIGTVPLLPDEEKTFPDTLADTPAVKLMCGMKRIEVRMDRKAEAPAEKAFGFAGPAEKKEEPPKKAPAKKPSRAKKTAE